MVWLSSTSVVNDGYGERARHEMESRDWVTWKDLTPLHHVACPPVLPYIATACITA